MEVEYCKAQHEVLRSFIGYILQFWGPRDELPLSYCIDDIAYFANHPSRRQTTLELNLVLARAICLATQLLKEWSAHGSNSDDSDHICKLSSFDESILKYGRPLGSGAFGGVTEATWMGNKYAQKKFQLPEHFLQPEAEALSNLNHPYIVKVHASSEDSLLLDLMSTDLQRFIRTRMRGGTRHQPFSLPAATDLMLQIVDAVSYLHSQGMVHRNLKSANIFVEAVKVSGDDLDEHGYWFAKVADFGLAKVKHEVTRFSHLTLNMGTRVEYTWHLRYLEPTKKMIIWSLPIRIFIALVSYAPRLSQDKVHSKVCP